MSDAKSAPKWECHARGDGVTSAMLERADPHWDYWIAVPSPPFAFGELGALVHGEERAALIASAPTLLAQRDALLEAAEEVMVCLDQHQKMLAEEGEKWAFSIAYDKQAALRAAIAQAKEQP